MMNKKIVAAKQNVELKAVDDMSAPIPLDVQRIVRVAFERASFYGSRFRDTGIDPSRLRTIGDFRRIPLMDQSDLMNTPSLDLLACDRGELETVYSSGGTTGKPKLMLYDKGYRVAGNSIMERVCQVASIREMDMVGIFLPINLSGAGNEMMKGLLSNSVGVIPFTLGTPDEMVIEVLKSTGYLMNHIVATPPTVVNLIELFKRHEITSQLKLKTIIVGGQPLRESIRQYIEAVLGAQVFNIFGSTEFGVMGIECREHKGVHLFDDIFYCEVLDQETGEPVPEGEVGELCITTLKSMGTVLIRYNVKDLVLHTTEKCDCGWAYPRFTFLGRSDHTLFLRHKVFKHQIDHTLESFKSQIGEYRVEVTQEGSADIMNFTIEAVDHSDENLRQALIRSLEQLSDKVEKAVARGEMGVRVELVSMGSIPKTHMGKVENQVVDRRH